MSIWKSLDFVGRPNHYVNEYGDIDGPKGILKQGTDNGGYRKVDLYLNGQGKTLNVHRLVALAFIPNPKAYPQVNHIDGNKLNNVVTNLEWVTQEQNMQHSTKALKKNSGLNHYACKFSEQDIRYIREHIEISGAALARQYNTTPTAICQIRKRKRYKDIT